ncbi:MAG: phosphatase PAP2 family protein [Phycisphaerales bacterium]|nr:phosphatase PAP2 family protein [Phycisphaerales bacterium]MCB9863425.1 phosphatase PAP2 family protein [Phycisphaerales bacterium]
MTVDSRPRWISRWRTIVSIVLLALCIVGLAGADRWFYETVSLKFNTLSPVDADGYHQSKWIWNLARFWPHITGGFCCYFMIFAFAKRGYRKANAALFSVLLTALIAHALQCGIGRARPNQAESALTFIGVFEAGFTAKGVGLPSGEAATATAMSLIVGFAFSRRRYIAWMPTVLVILARLLPGMHYLSDVAAGCLLALLLTPALYRLALRPPRIAIVDAIIARGRHALRNRAVS